jgi:hypothetical protein
VFAAAARRYTAPLEEPPSEFRFKRFDRDQKSGLNDIDPLRRILILARASSPDC